MLKQQEHVVLDESGNVHNMPKDNFEESKFVNHFTLHADYQLHHIVSPKYLKSLVHFNTMTKGKFKTNELEIDQNDLIPLDQNADAHPLKIDI